MKALAALALCLPLSGMAQDSQTQREIQRALIQRDQQTAEFAAGVRGADRAALETLHARQLRDAGRGLGPEPVIAREMQGYERGRMADERELRLSPPIARVTPPPQAPAPLPGEIRHGVDPVTVQSGRD